MKVSLSCVLATYNEVHNIVRCLGSVNKLVDEIIVVDGRSSDETVTVAKRFTDKVYVTKNHPIFHINKQKAIDKAQGDWILQLDADEVVTPELATEIQTRINSDPQENGFFIKRKNFFLGKWIKKGGWYPDAVIRLFRRGKGHLPCKSVHEQIVIDGQVGTLSHHLIHYSYSSVEEYWEKAKRYIALRIQDLRQQYQGKKPLVLMLSPIWLFGQLYVRHGLFVEGYRGFLIALFSAVQEYKAVKTYLQGKQYAYPH